MSLAEIVTLAAAPSRRASILLVALLAAAGSTAATRADWLVLATGESVETKGSWTVQGPKVIFTTTHGVLSSVRASEVNVDASRALTAKKQEDATKAAVPASAAPKPAPVLVLTDKDFAKKPEARAAGADGAGSSATGGAAAGAAGATAQGGASGPQSGQPIVVPAEDSLETRVAHQMPGPVALRVVHWSARPTGEDQLSIFGTVQNVGGRVTAGVDITVTLIDSEGRRIGASNASVTSTALMPQAQANFEAKFDSSANFAEVQFALKTVEIELGKPESGEDLEEPVGEPATAPATGKTPAASAPATNAPGAKASAPAPVPATAKPGAAAPVGDEPHATAKSAIKPHSR
jgi:hypothetical protein